MIKIITSWVLLVIFISFLPLSYASVVKKAYSLCKNKSIIRTVRVLEQEGRGCITVYTKSGVDRVVASGNFLKSCLTVMSKIRRNLENAFWKCRDISETEIVSTIPLSIEPKNDL